MTEHVKVLAALSPSKDISFYRFVVLHLDFSCACVCFGVRVGFGLINDNKNNRITWGKPSHTHTHTAAFVMSNIFYGVHAIFPPNPKHSKQKKKLFCSNNNKNKTLNLCFCPVQFILCLDNMGL